MKILLGALISALTFSAAAANAQIAHQSPCHSAHTCPSDHASYVWRGMFCVSPTADERNKTFKTRVRYQGRFYFCHR